jgi:hypothetical protein
MQELNEEQTFFLIDQDLHLETTNFMGRVELANTRVFTDSRPFSHSLLRPFASDHGNAPVFRYGRMFRHPELPQFRPSKESLIELGLDMKEELSPGENRNIPAGYVYLGQFIDHDLSFNTKTNMTPGGEEPIIDETSFRSPTLDLDSLYGLNPAQFKLTEFGGKVYQEDGVRLRFGQTHKDTDIPDAPVPPNDLPRNGDPQKRELAAVVDPRNDENLATAQTHLSFIKFHNAVVDSLAGSLSGNKLFEAARTKVIRHYQWIILRDYLPKVIEKETLDDVIENGCRYLMFEAGETPAVPIEFAMAAFRFGHSMVNRTYEWNRFFQTHPPGFHSASIDRLFMFTGFGSNNLFNKKQLLNTWVIDWSRFFDFTDIPGITNNQFSNHARKIVPSVVAGLTNIPSFIKGEDRLMSMLPSRNLLRGRDTGLPTGQCVAQRIGAAELTPNQIKNGASARRRDILERSGFDRFTPLWYYILKEAEECHEGERLGPVGSRIVAETFVAIIKNSEVSILPKETPGGPIWEPSLGVRKGQFSMPELLFFVHQATGDHINPLGDGIDNRRMADHVRRSRRPSA